MSSKLFRWSVALMFGVSAPAIGEVTEVSVQGTFSVADGKSFGEVGAYEYVYGQVTGTLDPADPRNAVITNLDRAETDKTGVVHYSADFALLRPVDHDKGSQKLLVEIPNRGRKYVLQMMNDAKPARGRGDAAALSPEASAHPVSSGDVGHGFLMRRGYTVAWVGWETIGIRDNLMRADLPIARGITGQVREEFVIGSRIPRGQQQLDLSYKAEDSSDLLVSVRDDQHEARRELPKEHWELSDDHRAVLPKGDNKVLPGKLYEATYAAKDPEVLGVGFSIVRDFVSALRDPGNGAAKEISPAVIDDVPTYDSVMGIGFSQPARFLREFFELGMNEDLSGEKVFDGLLIYTAGVGKSLANLPFGTPFRSNTRFQDHNYPEFRPPFSFGEISTTIDAEPPLVMEINTSSEYRIKGAYLLHTDKLGRADVDDPQHVRHYALAGMQHNGRPGMSLKRGNCRYVQNPNNPSPILRALLVAMSEWVEVGTKPPNSRVGRIDNGTLVDPDKINFPSIPDVEQSSLTNEIGSATSGHYRVPEVDADGNEIAGIRTPAIAVPLGTYTGWNYYTAPFPESQVCHMYGSFFPFEATKSGRAEKADPRLSVEERYEGVDDYVSSVTEAAEAMRDERLLLDEDVVRYVDVARETEIVK
jgi:hypothetical protein